MRTPLYPIRAPPPRLCSPAPTLAELERVCAMDAALFDGETPIFRRGDGITVRYRYVGFNEGSRVGRYLTAGIGGSSKVLLEADFVGPNGTLLARVRGEGSVSGGLFGGSNKTGIDKAIEEIADYAARTFR